MGYGYGGFFAPKPTMAQRRREAEKRVSALAKKGRELAPVKVSGRAMARTFWGQAWCENIESYSDFANRLPRGRSYVRHGCVVDLQIAPGRVTAMVSGSAMYQVRLDIERLSSDRWQALVADCGGKIDSLIELLQGELSQSVLALLVRRDAGLFPSPREMALKCSCPDWATMCKHVAATLYAVGTRLDEQPELFFVLRQVDQMELIAGAGASAMAGSPIASGSKRLDSTALGSVFGIELEGASPPPPPAPQPKAPAVKAARARKPAKAAPVPVKKNKKRTAAVARKPSKPDLPHAVKVLVSDLTNRLRSVVRAIVAERVSAARTATQRRRKGRAR